MDRPPVAAGPIQELDLLDATRGIAVRACQIARRPDLRPRNRLCPPGGGFLNDAPEVPKAIPRHPVRDLPVGIAAVLPFSSMGRGGYRP